MTERIVEQGLRKIVEERGTCEWYDSEKIFKNSKCSPECNGNKNRCSNGYYTSRRKIQIKNRKIGSRYENNIPDYLL